MSSRSNGNLREHISAVARQFCCQFVHFCRGVLWGRMENDVWKSFVSQMKVAEHLPNQNTELIWLVFLQPSFSLRKCHRCWTVKIDLLSFAFSLKKSGTEVDPLFRLWLSSKPDSSFPISVLQSGLKVSDPKTKCGFPQNANKCNKKVIVLSFGTGLAEN